jgi:DNA-binding Xre family transcriptional regulator
MDALDKQASVNLKRLWDDHKIRTGETQTEFAERIGMSQSNYAIYLNGHQPISLRVLIKICKGLKCNPSDIRHELKDGYYL